MSIDFEKLGSFYLGKDYDLDTRARRDGLVLYDSKDLVTHAVCVGMTGSGKTGLCLGLLEEAAIDGIPSIIIDPKGDLPNLLLAFPELAPADFRPWVNEDDARRKGMTPDEYAAQQATLWKSGLAEWGQDPERIRRLKDAAEFVVYTPGSTAGLGVSVLKSFAAPPFEIVDDTELFRERISSTVTSLLGLLGITADPLQSREHILLSTIFDKAWSAAQDLDLATLIRSIQTPPVTRVGVMELETFFPAQDRFTLAMSLNNLIASPGFSRWMDGEALDIGAMLHTPQGKPRVSIFSIAHLSDAERMFFVSLLLNQTLGWVRTQSGTTSLRAILYMDEIAGYFPPVANPPSKQPLLTLMKQARAFGLGVVLATQNPVDLDYKGLANAGTWFIGRLQTERDKQRVLDGLEGACAQASAVFDRSGMDGVLSRLGTRVFLMNNVHETQPVVFETRWCLSYLRGPMTRTQIKTLMDPHKAAQTAAATGTTTPRPVDAPPHDPLRQSAPIEPAPTPPTAAPAPVRAEATPARAQAAPARAAAAPATAPPKEPTALGADHRPVLPPEIPQFFVPSKVAITAGVKGGLTYRPMVLGSAKVYYSDAKAKVEQEVAACFLAEITPGPVLVDWDAASEVEFTEEDVEHDPTPGVSFAPLPPEAGRVKSFEAWKKNFADTLYRTHRLEMFRVAAVKLVSKPHESERDFLARAQMALREQRDEAVEKLRQKFAPKAQTLQDKLRRAQQQVEAQRQQAKDARVSSALSVGGALFSALLGRKLFSAGNVTRATSAAKSGSRASREAADVGRAEENAEALEKQLHELESQFQQEARELAAEYELADDQVERVSLKPKKTGISVRTVVLAWAPCREDGSPAWA
jgi:hypothetical protein